MSVEALPIHEVTLGVSIALGVLGIFSQKQKEWLRRRDTNGHGVPECQFPDCGRDLNHVKKGGLHAHHITPAGWFKKHLLGLSDFEDEQTENFPENGIILCADKHHNGPQGVHPDYAKALTDYRKGDKLAFKKVAIKHGQMEEQGEVYWNTENDQLLYEVAKDRTQEYLASHPEDPFPYD